MFDGAVRTFPITKNKKRLGFIFVCFRVFFKGHRCKF